MESYRSRRAKNRIVQLLCIAACATALLPLFGVLFFVISRGAAGLSVAFFTELPRPVGEAGGGMAHAIWGSLQMVGLATLLAVPAGVGAGIFLLERGETRLGRLVRFCADVMSGIPSITVGIFVYGVVVVTTQQFSGFAGALALSVIMLPTLTRTVEEVMRLVPEGLREAALGLGVSRWRTSLRVVLRTALPGVVTGIMLAIARVAGETAPLLFTALGNRFWSGGMDEPTASLPVQIYTYAVSPYEDWHNQAWTAALVLLLMVLSLNIAARLIARPRVGAK